MAAINVHSEIKPLKKVLLHRPGKELLNLTPDTLSELLFDDIPFLKDAQAEHDEFAQILRDNGAEVVYLEDLMADVIRDNAEVREKFIRQWIEEADVKNPNYKEAVYNLINGIKDPKELVLKTMEGVNFNELDLGGRKTLAELVNQENSFMVVNPMPNLYFTRDPFASMADGATLNRMFSVTRNRETIYAYYIFNNHPDFKGKMEIFYDRNANVHIEGGDELILSDKVLALGISQRTQAEAIEILANNLFNSNAGFEKILAFDIPVSRAFMHLDTVFTMIDTDKFTVHPGILGTLRVFEITKGENGLNIKLIEDKLENILANALGLPKVTLIQCAGGDALGAAREQWNDGSNTLCIAPGTVIVYDRNEVTNKILEEYGIKVLKMTSHELSRGRGGPRCMSMPLVRED